MTPAEIARLQDLLEQVSQPTSRSVLGQFIGAAKKALPELLDRVEALEARGYDIEQGSIYSETQDALDEVDRLSTENAKLRAAIEEIARENCDDDWCGEQVDGQALNCSVCVARAALAASPEPGEGS